MPDLALAYGGPILSVSSAPASSAAVIATASGSIHTKGAWTELLASIEAPGSWLHVTLLNASASRSLVDIGIGAAASEVVLIPDLYHEVNSANAQNAPRSYLLPVAVPSGARLVARTQSTNASQAIYVNAHVVSRALTSPMPLGQVEALGIDVANTRGVVIDPGASANTDSAWSQLIAATGFAYRWLMIGIGHSSGVVAAAATWLVDIAIGGAGAEVVVVPDILVGGSTANDLPLPGSVSLPVAIPAGTRVAARARCSLGTATTRTIDVMGWGVG